MVFLRHHFENILLEPFLRTILGSPRNLSEEVKNLSALCRTFCGSVTIDADKEPYIHITAKIWNH